MVYLYHLDEKLAHSQHYIGFVQDKKDYLTRRLTHHRNNRGAKFLMHVNKAGITYDVVRTWPGADRNFERRLKKQKNAARLCPVCKRHKKLLAAQLAFGF